jgi:hypothetical protein
LLTLLMEVGLSANAAMPIRQYLNGSTPKRPASWASPWRWLAMLFGLKSRETASTPSSPITSSRLHRRGCAMQIACAITPAPNSARQMAVQINSSPSARPVRLRSTRWVRHRGRKRRTGAATRRFLPLTAASRSSAFDAIEVVGKRPGLPPL